MGHTHNAQQSPVALSSGLQPTAREARERKDFFSEEKKQKTFIWLSRPFPAQHTLTQNYDIVTK
jgi:hypothetical protein